MCSRFQQYFFVSVGSVSLLLLFKQICFSLLFVINEVPKANINVSVTVRGL